MKTKQAGESHEADMDHNQLVKGALNNFVLPKRMLKFCFKVLLAVLKHICSASFDEALSPKAELGSPCSHTTGRS
jgi:hypothetical protein